MIGITCSLLSAELWGLVRGLRIAQDLQLKHLIIEMDSLVVVNMIRSRRTHCIPLQPLLDEALAMMDSMEWKCEVTHIYREANCAADALANLGHGQGFDLATFDAVPGSVRLVLEDDFRGVCLPRLVL